MARFLATIVVGSSPEMRNRCKDASGEHLKRPEQPSTKAQAADRKPGKVTGAWPPLGWALGQEPGKLMLSGHLLSTRLIPGECLANSHQAGTPKLALNTNTDKRVMSYGENTPYIIQLSTQH